MDTYCDVDWDLNTPNLSPMAMMYKEFSYNII